MKTSFGTNRRGEAVSRYEIADGNLRVAVLDQGATVQSAVFDSVEVILGYDDIAGYEQNEGYLGATVGRYANRIAHGKFKLDGKEYQLDCNENGITHLHGGSDSICNRLWQVKEHCKNAITLCITDEGNGYPGKVEVSVRFSVEQNELRLDYTAVGDSDTPINLTNHAYFNLGGVGSGDILDTELTLSAGEMTPVDKTLIPTGEIVSVADTPFDFRCPTAIGARIRAQDEQLRRGGGYDHNFCIDGTGLRPFCTALSPKSKICMTGFTDQPGVQLYTGNVLSTRAGRRDLGRADGYAKHEGFCLETQHYPDSPNHPSFPSALLKAGEVFRSTTIYAFERGNR